MSTRGLIGRLAVQQGMISREQLQQAIHAQGTRPDLRLGEVLVGLGFIDEEQLGALLASQARLKTPVARSKRNTPVPVQRPVPEGVTLGAIALKRVASVGTSSEASADTDAERREGAEARGWLLGLLADAVATGASDVLILPDQPVRLCRFGRMHDFTTGAVSASGTERLLHQTLSAAQIAELDRRGQVSVGFEAAAVGRFRLQVHRDLAGVGATFHRTHLSDSQPTFADLGLPNWVAGLTNLPHGLVLITGPSGSGRSTTMSALINLIGEERSQHIVVVETPREHRANAGEALITQLEVGVHCSSVEAAIIDAPRLDADILCIDELPDDAVDAALRAADTDQLVIATLRSPSSPRAIEQLIDSYPSADRRAGLMLVSDSLKAVLTQRLVPAVDRESRDDGGLALALEVVHVDDHTRELIRSDSLGKISAHVQNGRAEGSRMLDAALRELVMAGRVSIEAARAHARNPALFANEAALAAESHSASRDGNPAGDRRGLRS